MLSGKSVRSSPMTSSFTQFESPTSRAVRSTRRDKPPVVLVHPLRRRSRLPLPQCAPVRRNIAKLLRLEPLVEPSLQMRKLPLQLLVARPAVEWERAVVERGLNGAAGLRSVGAV